MWASYKGRIIIVQELLDRGANPNTKAEVSFMLMLKNKFTIHWRSCNKIV